LKRKLLLLTIDAVCLFVVGVLSLFVRFGWDFSSIALYLPTVFTPILLSLVFLWINGTYSIVWSYMSLKELWVILRAIAMGFLVNMLFHAFLPWVLPRSIALMFFLGAAIILILSRMGWVWVVHSAYAQKQITGPKRILIVGGEEKGVRLLDELRTQARWGQVVGFVDNSPRTIGRKIRGVPVYGPVDHIDRIVAQLDVHEIVISNPQEKNQWIQTIIRLVDPTRIKIKVLPGLNELLGDTPLMGWVREVDVEDLLNREPVRIDLQMVQNSIRDQKILITGAGGSIGSEIAMQVAMMEPGEIMLLGRGENSIYQIDQTLQLQFPHLKRSRIIGDVADRAWMESVFRMRRPDLVYHAAAHKHVPLMEENPYEAFRVNCLGTMILADLCIQYAVNRFTMISSDKVVHPTSVMGASKRIAEMYIKSLAAESLPNTHFSVVRFGNVLGSRGSVIPLFKQQIEHGGPITITDPKMKRFFMTISEACSLVLQASTMSCSGEIFVLDMGEQILIKELARKLCILMGVQPETQIPFVYTGSRDGEKLYEELFLDSEEITKTTHPKILHAIDAQPYPAQEIRNLITNLVQEIRNHSKHEWVEILDPYIPDHQLKKEEPQC